MHDYSITESEERQFILNYEVKDEKIVVYFASNKGRSNYYVPYTKENEKKILNKMKEQVYEADKRLKETKRSVKDDIPTILTYASIFIALGLISVYIPGSVLVTVPLTILTGTVFIGKTIIGLVKDTMLRNDLEKNLKFLKKEDYLNSNVLENRNMLSDVSKNTKKIIKANSEQEKPLTINTIDEIPFKDIETILQNIEREKKFEFDYTKSEEKPKTLTKTK